MTFLNALVCILIPLSFALLLIMVLSSCSTTVHVQNPIETPEIPKAEIEELSGLLIDEPRTEADLMNNLYVVEGLLYIYMDYTDALEGYIGDLSSYQTDNRI